MHAVLPMPARAGDDRALVRHADRFTCREPNLFRIAFQIATGRTAERVRPQIAAFPQSSARAKRTARPARGFSVHSCTVSH